MLVQDTQESHDSAEWVTCLTYKSIATAAPRASDLDVLASQARARNRSLDVTGMLLFEDGCFLQTLEGPPKAVAQLWSSIERDGRHQHIEVLSEHMTAARLFSDWDLLLDGRSGDMPREAARPSPVPPAVAEHLSRLVELALNTDDLAINTMIAGFAEQGWTSAAILSLLIEPAARALGDAWLNDDCSELDLTIGLSMLQLAGHAVRYSPCSQSIRNSRYRILLATAPGEKHMLGTALLADQFLAAGWQVDMAFPESEEALTNQLNAQHPDAVDIGLSDAMPRQHTIDQLRSTIEHSRMVVSEHPTVISVGGRLFAEATATALSVGADHARKGLAGTSIRLAELVRQNRKG
ncbi:BLUF domain-containing protein [Erythrobacter donghaensis]|uniref:BLUF domain-containing protein n=1 Tax=Erythrobacter donghaensis TaxID=267135 RepID=UPI000A390C35|nr:BLUF domain-containing protein [Erythrobacter donghaensis]